ncbi:MAG: C69 family dipeptidase [Bacteroidales bacterium]|nr:C69 family dipeptidase [Bacteroidales bacterium]
MANIKSIWKSIFFILLLTSAFEAVACFAIVVGKEASTDGSVLVGHSEMNDPPPQFLNFRLIPGGSNPEGAVIHLRNGGTYPDVRESYSFIWSEIMGSTGSDGMLNEWGVVCVSNATRTREVDWDEMVESGDIEDGGISWRIRTEIARRAKTARAGLNIVNELMTRFGYARGGVTLIVADPNEAWIVTLARGPRWVAQRVPDDEVVVLANVNIIGELDLKDTSNYRASPDLIDFAIKKGWYSKDGGEPFNFKKAYDFPSYNNDWFYNNYNCDPRQWRGQCLVTGTTIGLPVKHDLPYSVKPYKKLSVQDLRQFLSDHLEGTEFDKTKDCVYGGPHDLMTIDDGLICNQANQEVAVFQLRNWLPPEVGCIYWRTMSVSCSGVLIPWYLGIKCTSPAFNRFEPGEPLTTYDHFNPPEDIFSYNPDHAFWIFNELENLVDLDYRKNINPVSEKWQILENRIFSNQYEFEQEALGLLKQDIYKGRDLLTKHSNDLALQAVDDARQLIFELRTKLFGY